VAGLIHLRIAAWTGLAMLLGGLTVAGPVAAADRVSFGGPSATSSFGKSVDFKQPVSVAGTPARAEILISTPGSIGPDVVPVPQAAAAGSTVMEYQLDVANGQLVPNTTLSARWRLVDEAGRTWLGPIVHQTYVDDRFDWRTLRGNVVRVHWYEGDDALGARAVKIGDDAIAAATKLLGVTEAEPIDFFIYADQQPFYDALGPGTRENVGGQAHPDIRTLFALIAPDEINAGWIESVVPHELTHVVFATAVDNPYHEPPHWLNEGLAVYLSDGYDASFKAVVANAARDGSIMPLDGLAGAFPTAGDRFFLAYGESVSAVDRIVRVSGRDSLVRLIRSYRGGVSDDQAFQAALGRDLAGFEADWLADIGAEPPKRLGPQPAPAGPLPAGWNGPQPNPSFDVVGSEAPGAVTTGTTANSNGAWLALVIPIVGVGALLAVLTLAVAHRRVQRGPIGPLSGGGAQSGPVTPVEPPAGPRTDQ
jgi:hypothetical protein